MSASYEADCPAAYRQLIEGGQDVARGGPADPRASVPQHEQGEVTGILVAALCEIAASAPADPAEPVARHPRAQPPAAGTTAGAAPPVAAGTTASAAPLRAAQWVREEPPTVRSGEVPFTPAASRACAPPPLPAQPLPTPPPLPKELRVTIRPASAGAPSQWQDICWERPTLPAGSLSTLPPGDPAATTERAGNRTRMRGAMDAVVVAMFACALIGLAALAYLEGWHHIWAALG